MKKKVDEINWDDLSKFYEKKIKELEQELFYNKQCFTAVKFLADYNKAHKPTRRKDK